MDRSPQTLHIEKLLKQGHSISSIARDLGISRTRVQQVNKRARADYTLVTATTCTQEPQTTCTPAGQIHSQLLMKSLTVQLTPAVHDALVEACELTNRKAPDEPITIVEYVEELIINRVVELGLLRKNKRK